MTRAAPATAVRVLMQLRRDRRTIALVLIVPLVLMTLVESLFNANPAQFDRLGAPMLGLFPLIVMFLITSIAMLRERTGGTLERLMTLPLTKLDLLAGYGVAFGFVGAVQAALVTTFSVTVLGLDVSGSIAAVLALAVANAELGMSLGLFVSAFARTEFQAVQFMPAFILPQLLLCGLFVSRDDMAGWLHTLSALLPMTYAYDALVRVADGQGGSELVLDIAVVLGSTCLALALGAATLRRRTA